MQNQQIFTVKLCENPIKITKWYIITIILKKLRHIPTSDQQRQAIVYTILYTQLPFVLQRTAIKRSFGKSSDKTQRRKVINAKSFMRHFKK